MNEQNFVQISSRIINSLRWNFSKRNSSDERPGQRLNFQMEGKDKEAQCRNQTFQEPEKIDFLKIQKFTASEKNKGKSQWWFFDTYFGLISERKAVSKDFHCINNFRRGKFYRLNAQTIFPDYFIWNSRSQLSRSSHIDC